jgi:hypothetical protein
MRAHPIDMSGDPIAAVDRVVWPLVRQAPPRLKKAGRCDSGSMRIAGTDISRA